MSVHDEIEKIYREQFEIVLKPLVNQVATLTLSSNRVGLLYLADLVTAMFRRAVDCLPDEPIDKAEDN